MNQIHTCYHPTSEEKRQQKKIRFTELFSNSTYKILNNFNESKDQCQSYTYNHYENMYEDPFEWSYTDLFRYERNAMHYYDKQFLFKSQYV